MSDDDDVRETKARRGDGEYGRLYEGAEGRSCRGTHGHSRPSMLMLVRSAAALATMRPVLLVRVLKKAARR